MTLYMTLALVVAVAGASIAADLPEASGIESMDHAGMIRSWNAESLARGEQLYQGLCITCHGNLEQAGSLPTSRPFWKEPFKNGADPFSLYKTLTLGLGQMPAWTFLTPEQRYDAIHYIREVLVKPHNPGAYFRVTPEYLAGLPKGTGRGTKTAEMIEFEKGPKYLRMDFGPTLFWTLQVESNNIAYKGIAVRLDQGHGGISKGRAWMLYDHDTMRVAAAWTGEGFVDWKGIAFDGSHGTHTSIVGQRVFVNPPGPGWGHPDSGSWSDPRPLGRDGKPFGPLPRDWVRYRGMYVHGDQVVISYTVGDVPVLELPGLLKAREGIAVSRTFNLGASRREMRMRIAPASSIVALSGNNLATVAVEDGFHVLRIPASSNPVKVQVLIAGAGSGVDESTLGRIQMASVPDLAPLTRGGQARWNPPLATRGKQGPDQGPLAIDELTFPPEVSNPWRSWMRFGGFDFFEEGRRAAICTWNGDVWLVDGVDADLSQLTWKRFATGLFQPLGLKIVNGVIHVACRDQIARLHDLNGDDEADYIESFNNDHQVTEHFHEFAMGLQTDAAGHFYYAKSARHALTAVVPHHGTLLRVDPDGSRTEIIANGFRAANGVCVNEDGTFFVTDQEGHWTPKNRINSVRMGGFYGNMFGYHTRTSNDDQDMEQPLVWITNEMDRSPGELLWVSSQRWGPLKGSLLSLSYGTGRIFVVPHERQQGQVQGGVVALPIPEFPTGTMRGRFHSGNGQLYTCGLYAWAGNRQSDGGFFRLRATGKAFHVPVGLRAFAKGIEIRFSDPLDRASATNPKNFAAKAWALKRSASYGSKHLDEHALSITGASLASDHRTVFLTIPGLHPTRGMELKTELRGEDGASISRTIHHTIHNLDPADPAR